VLLETARVFGQLAKDGWKPRRSILLCSWDAEEYAIVGSSEFTERHYNTLFQKAAVYLNLDIAVEGTEELVVSASPSFQSITEEAANSVSLSGALIGERWKNKYISLLGTGSDFVPFIHHTGVSSFTMRLTDTSNMYQAVYHSNYDSYYWYSHFGDPEFLGHASMTQLYGISPFFVV
jgi:N-acetylated-alpha-linked acidic dipeptidase